MPIFLNDADFSSNDILNAANMPVAIPKGKLTISDVAQFVVPGVSLQTQSTGALSANQVRYFPIQVDYSTTFDQIGIAVTAFAASSTIRLGIYSLGSDMDNITLVLDAGTVASTSNGNKTISISQTLNPGLYYLACNSDSNPTVRVYRGNIPHGLLIAGLGGSPLLTNIRATQTYGTFPSTGTVPEAVSGTTVGYDHMVFLRPA